MADKNYKLDTTGLEFEQALTHARNTIAEAMKILQTEPAAMLYLSICEMIPVKDGEVTLRLSTANAGGQIQLQYNPYWICRLDDASELAFVLFVESMRIALHHATHRRGLPAASHKLASDLICSENQKILSKWRPEVKAVLGSIPSYNQIKSIVEPMGFDKSEMWQLEKIRDYLRKIQEEQEPQSNFDKDLNDNANGQSGSHDGDEEGKSNDENDSKDPMNEDIRGNKAPQDGDNDTANAFNQHFAADERSARKATQEWGENTLVDGEVRQMTNHIAANPEMWGSLPGQIQEMIRRANLPKFDPTPIVKHWKQTIQSEEMYDTRAKTNRRHDDELPGWRHKVKSSMVECVDASGSMSDEDVAMGEAFINLFIKHCETWFCYWDAACGPIERIKHKQKGDIELVNMRGGTNPQCIIERIEEEKKKFGGILVFTDNGFNWPRPKTKYVNKIFIIGTENCVNPPEWCRHFLNIKDIRKWMKEHNFAG